MNEEIIHSLIISALGMRKMSYAPYSHFSVGAALLAADGTVYTGCNIENAAYGPSNCAERTAFFKAVSEGVKSFAAIAIAGGSGEEPQDFTAPCGVCRQVMAEFCDPETFMVIMAKSPTEYRMMPLEELLPLAFRPENLGR